MKNKYSSKDAGEKKKGFYVMLLASLGVLAVLGTIVSFNNFTSAKNNLAKKDADKIKVVTTDEAAPANNSKEKQLAYTDPAENANSNDVVLKPIDEVLAPEDSVAENEEYAEDLAKKETPADEPKIQEQQQPTSKEESNQESKKEEVAPKEAPANEDKTSNEDNTSNEDKTSEAEEQNVASEPVFSPFTADSKMSWPIIGDIVMDYNVEHVLYDKTLELYRTNDNICIKADIGEQVKATSDGIVKMVAKTSDMGNVVVVDNGNGWLTTYGQLQDNILVKEGDVVTMGEVIAGVANPSKNSILLGSHLTLKVTKDNQPVDPKGLLIQ